MAIAHTSNVVWSNVSRDSRGLELDKIRNNNPAGPRALGAIPTIVEDTNDRSVHRTAFTGMISSRHPNPIQPNNRLVLSDTIVFGFTKTPADHFWNYSIVHRLASKVQLYALLEFFTMNYFVYKFVGLSISSCYKWYPSLKKKNSLELKLLMKTSLWNWREVNSGLVNLRTCKIG